LLVHIIRP